MPIPKPRKNEEKDAFISRCISTMKKVDPNREEAQIMAICYTAWRKRKSGISKKGD
jgi:hypothetical protein